MTSTARNDHQQQQQQLKAKEGIGSVNQSVNASH